MLALDLTIRTYGWSLAQIDDGPLSWSYTIGLTENYDHPELTIIGLELEAQSAVIHEIVEMIEETGGIDDHELEALGIELVEVHPDHLFGDRFATWSNRYERVPPAGTFLQIIPPPSWFCECHRHSMPRFDLPDPNRTGNRAERRHRKRRP